MKLLYTCADHASDPLHWSGTVSNCRNALENAGVKLAVFDRIPFECPPPLRLLHQWYKRLGTRTHHLQFEPAVLRRAAARIATRFAEGDCDAVFCPGTGVPVAAYLPASIPVVSYLDATKRSWIETYFGLKTLCARSRRHLAAVDLGGLINHSLTVFSSDWARAEAAGDYQMPSDRMAVVPFGANLADPPPRASVESWIGSRRREPFRLLFLGKEWIRKGGPDALALIRSLRKLGQPATLDIVGCTPVLDAEERAYARVHGFIDHSQHAGAERFHTLLREAHVLLFLSRAEAYGIALCEAAAFGVPAYALRVGGIPTIVRHGENGWLGAAPFHADTAAATLATAWRSPTEYRRVALAARTDYEARLNWRVAGQSLRRHIEQSLTRRAS
ncbi:MAG: glycosyltransferase family 4 protein [Burkholderiales bacterium]|nr:glycosyltransferase family 4 protein [Opitutaceae bacterium]